MILTPLRKLPNNLGKIIVATGFECLPKVQTITQSGHTADYRGLTLLKKAEQDIGAYFLAALQRCRLRRPASSLSFRPC